MSYDAYRYTRHVSSSSSRALLENRLRVVIRLSYFKVLARVGNLRASTSAVPFPAAVDPGMMMARRP